MERLGTKLHFTHSNLRIIGIIGKRSLGDRAIKFFIQFGSSPTSCLIILRVLYSKLSPLCGFSQVNGMVPDLHDSSDAAPLTGLA